MKLIRWLPRFRRAYQELESLREREQWSRSDIQSFQLERLNQLWRHAATHVPYYRRLTETHDLPGQFSALGEFRERMPILTKRDIRDNPRDLLSSRAAAGTWRWTSGSTGRPMKFFWGHADHQQVLRCRYRFYAEWGVDIFDRTAFVWGVAQRRGLLGIARRAGQNIADAARNRLRLPAYDLSRDALRRSLERIERFRPTMLYGLSHAIHLLAVEAERSQMQWPELKVVVLTGEVAHPPALDAAARAFRVPAITEYGATECHLIAGQSTDGLLRVREDCALVETIARDDGAFDIILTVLANQSYPLLRYRIEDFTDAPLELPPRGFGTLANVAGRDGDLLHASDGRVIHPARLDLIFESERFGRPVRRYQVHQSGDGTVRVALEFAEPHAALDFQRLRSDVRELVGDFPVRLDVVRQLDSDRKHRRVTSELGARPSGVIEPGVKNHGGAEPQSLEAS